jgi:hypothetical protein
LLKSSGSPGEYVSLEETIKGFRMLLNGELDDLPEQAFYLVGNLDRNPKSRNSKIRSTIYGYEHSRSYPDRVICSTTADEIVLLLV